jgi:uncharacterized protein YndB with AHSA1/START domain
MKYAMTLLLLVAPVVHADVVESSPNSLRIRHKITTTATADKAWDAFLDISKWWSGIHTYSGSAANLRLDARPGGCFCETLPKGGGVQHMSVLAVMPRERLVLSGALGPLQTSGVAGAMTFQFGGSANGTQITLTYDIGGHVHGGLDQMAVGIDQVLGDQMMRLKRYLDTGNAEAAPAAKP